MIQSQPIKWCSRQEVFENLFITEDVEAIESKEDNLKNYTNMIQENTKNRLDASVEQMDFQQYNHHRITSKTLTLKYLSNLGTLTKFSW